MEQKILTTEAAVRGILSKLAMSGIITKNVININHNRYCIAETNVSKILIMHKKEPFYNFGKRFAHLGYKGVGDSLNVIDLKYALRNEVKKIYTVFPNGVVYSIPIMDIIDKGEKWKNKEGREVYSFSIHNYKREFEI